MHGPRYATSSFFSLTKNNVLGYANAFKKKAKAINISSNNID